MTSSRATDYRLLRVLGALSGSSEKLINRATAHQGKYAVSDAGLIPQWNRSKSDRIEGAA